MVKKRAGKVALPKASAGRPRNAMGTGSDAPQVTIRLDASTEAAVAALQALWQDEETGPPGAATALKRAAVEVAGRECRADYERALALIKARRQADAAE